MLYWKSTLDLMIWSASPIMYLLICGFSVVQSIYLFLYLCWTLLFITALHEGSYLIEHILIFLDIYGYFCLFYYRNFNKPSFSPFCVLIGFYWIYVHYVYREMNIRTVAFFSFLLQEYLSVSLVIQIPFMALCNS